MKILSECVMKMNINLPLIPGPQSTMESLLMDTTRGTGPPRGKLTKNRTETRVRLGSSDGEGCRRMKFSLSSEITVPAHVWLITMTKIR
jgi:hypothetical protein